MTRSTDEVRGGVTSDLSQFGQRERIMAELLLRAWNEGELPKDFTDDGVTIAMNPYSGCVFLANSEYQSVMLHDGKLESWYNCPECGHEGFKEDMDHGEGNAECRRYLEAIGVKEAAERSGK